MFGQFTPEPLPKAETRYSSNLRMGAALFKEEKKTIENKQS